MSIITLNSGTTAHFMAQGTDVQASINLDRLSDVTVTNVADNQVLKYDASQSQWVNVATGAITSLDQLSDVVITSVQDGQSLQYDNECLIVAFAKHKYIRLFYLYLMTLWALPFVSQKSHTLNQTLAAFSYL